jgi:hypothetical protein
VPKVGNLQAKTAIGLSNDVEDLISIASLRRDGVVIPVTEYFQSRGIGGCPSQPHRRPELSNRSRHARQAILMYHKRSLIHNNPGTG